MSLRELLLLIVDYAGFFPPAQLSLPEAINFYDRLRSSPHDWMLAHFVLPATQLQELIYFLSTLSEGFPPSQCWSLSVVLSKNWLAELEQIHQISETGLPSQLSIRISTLEIAPLSPNELQQLHPHLPAGVNTFFEIPFDVNLESYIHILQQIGTGAKLRTGGVTSQAFPSSLQLAQRILSLAKAQIPFKATAGLHHALRGDYFLDPSGHAATPMHGFLNVAIASALAYQQVVTLEEIVAILEETAIDSFRLSDTEIHWQQYSLSLDSIARSRQQFFRSFGSCSFQEPIEDLDALQLL